MYQGFVVNSEVQLQGLRKRLKLFPRVMVILDVHRNKLKAPKIIEQAGIKRTLPKGSIEIDPAESFI